MSVSISNGNNDPFRLLPADGDVSPIDTLRVGPLTEGDLQLPFVAALKRLTEQKPPLPSSKSDAANSASNASPRERPSAPRSTAELDDSERPPVRASREEANDSSGREAVGNDHSSAKPTASTSAEDNTSRPTDEPNAIEKGEPTDDRDESSSDAECSTLVIHYNFDDGIAAAESADEQDIPYGDDIVILPFPTAANAAPKSWADVYSAQPTVSIAEDDLPGTEIDPKLLEMVQQSASTDNIPLPASFALALSDDESAATVDSLAEIEVPHIEADVDGVDVTSLATATDVTSAPGENESDLPSDLCDLPVISDEVDAADDASMTGDVNSPSSSESPMTVPVLPAQRAALAQQTNQQVSDRQLQFQNSDGDARSDAASPTDAASSSNGIIESASANGEPQADGVSQNRVSSERFPQPSSTAAASAAESQQNSAAEPATSSDAAETAKQHMRQAEQAANEQSAGRNSVLVQSMSAPPANAASSQQSLQRPSRETSTPPAPAVVAAAAAGNTATVVEKEIIISLSAEKMTKPQAAAAEADSSSAPSSPIPGADDESTSLQPAKSTAPSTTAKVTRAPENLNPAHQLDRLASLVQQSERTDRTISVRLHPPELGALLIDVTERDGVMSARFEVQTQAAQKILGDSLPKLHDLLSQLGATVERIDVQLVTAESNQDRSGYDDPEQQRHRDHREQLAADGGDRQQFAGEDRQSSQSSSRDPRQGEQNRHDSAADQPVQGPHRDQKPASRPSYQPLDRIDIHI
ncbi:MAG: flagellar hook-length control protein FliK [Planctomycetaceae bacterium]